MTTRAAVLDRAVAEKLAGPTRLPRYPVCAAIRSLAVKLDSAEATAAEAAVMLRADVLMGGKLTAGEPMPGASPPSEEGGLGLEGGGASRLKLGGCCVLGLSSGGGLG